MLKTKTDEAPVAHAGASYVWMEGFLLLTVCNIAFYAWANNFVDGLLGIERIHTHPTAAAVIDYGPVVMLLPLLGLVYQDLQHNASKKFFTAVPDRIMNYVLRVVGGYGIVQVIRLEHGVYDAHCSDASTPAHTSARQHAHARTHINNILLLPSKRTCAISASMPNC